MRGDIKPYDTFLLPDLKVVVVVVKVVDSTIPTRSTCQDNLDKWEKDNPLTLIRGEP